MASGSYWTNGDKITAERLNEIEDCISPEFFIIYDQNGTLSEPYYAIEEAFTSGKTCIISSAPQYVMVDNIGGASNYYYVNIYTATDTYSYPSYENPGAM